MSEDGVAGVSKCEEEEGEEDKAAIDARAAVEEWGDEVQHDDENDEEEEDKSSKQRHDKDDEDNSAATIMQQLPPHWAAAQDPSTGAVYFYDQLTGVRSWQPPPPLVRPSHPPAFPRLPPAAPSSTPQLPPELAKLHAALDKVDSTLTDADIPRSPPLAAAPTAAAPGLDGPSSLPPAAAEATAASSWVELWDAGTGRVFYYHAVSQATRWDMPPGFQGETRTAWPDPGGRMESPSSLPIPAPTPRIQPSFPPPCDRDVRMLSHYFDPSTLAANREETKRRRREEEAGGRGVDWRKVKEARKQQKKRKAMECLYKD